LGVLLAVLGLCARHRGGCPRRRYCNAGHRRAGGRRVLTTG